MDAHAQHRLEVSLRRMAIDTSNERSLRQAQIDAMRLREMDQQVQIEVSGTATATPGSMLLDVPFEIAFTTANGRRSSHLTRPHATFGFEQTSAADADGVPTEVAVILAATVMGWEQQGHSIVGARLAVSALAPSTVVFRGLIHATFQGLGLPQDEPDLEG